MCARANLYPECQPRREPPPPMSAEARTYARDVNDGHRGAPSAIPRPGWATPRPRRPRRCEPLPHISTTGGDDHHPSAPRLTTWPVHRLRAVWAYLEPSVASVAALEPFRGSQRVLTAPEVTWKVLTATEVTQRSSLQPGLEPITLCRQPPDNPLPTTSSIAASNPGSRTQPGSFRARKSSPVIDRGAEIRRWGEESGVVSSRRLGRPDCAGPTSVRGSGGSWRRTCCRHRAWDRRMRGLPVLPWRG